VLERREQIGKLTWGVDEVDELLGGGVETQSITEVYGEFRGRQVPGDSPSFSVTVQLPSEHGGLEGSTIFVDSEDTFRPERIDQMVRGLDDEVLADTMEFHGIVGEDETADPTDEGNLEAPVESVLDKIHVAKAFNSNHQILLAEKAQGDRQREPRTGSSPFACSVSTR